MTKVRMHVLQRFGFFTFWLLAWLCLSDWISAQSSAVLKSEFVYDDAPFPSCHATTLVETSAGIVCAWFGGQAEGELDVGIWMARNETGQWSKPNEVANGIQSDGSRFPCWNPVLFQPNDAPLMLFYKVGPSPQLWWGELKTSTDGGVTWAAAIRLPDGILGPIKNKPVQLSNGDILCPTSNETPETPSKWQVKFERTSDLGRTWTKTNYLNDGIKLSAIQPSVLGLGGDKLLAVGRTRQSRVFRIASDDNGATWSDMSLTDLPNPNSGTDAVTLKDGRHLIVYNHSDKHRSPLNVSVSSDAKTWKQVVVLEDEPNAEFSYPAIIQTRDGLVHISFTWKRKKIKHIVLDPSKLTN